MFMSRYQNTRHNIKENNKQNNLEELQKKKMSLEELQSGFKQMSNVKANMYNRIANELRGKESDEEVETSSHPISVTMERSRKFLQSLDLKKKSLGSSDLDISPIQPEHPSGGLKKQPRRKIYVSDEEEERELEEEIASLDQQIYCMHDLMEDPNSDIFTSHKEEEEIEETEEVEPVKLNPITPPRNTPKRVSLSPYEIHKDDRDMISRLDRLKELIEYKKELDKKDILIERIILGLRKENQMHRYKLTEIEKFSNEFSWSEDNILEDIKKNLFNDKGILDLEM